MYLKTWCPVGGIVWEGLGGMALLEEAYYWVWDLIASQLGSCQDANSQLLKPAPCLPAAKLPAMIVTARILWNCEPPN